MAVHKHDNAMASAVTVNTKNKPQPSIGLIQADSTGKLPTRIEILKAGVWRTPYHGDFMIASEDLDELIENFKAGVGLADGGKAGAPIDFSHENHREAAAWIKQLSRDGDTLFGDVEWTEAGKTAVLGGMFKFFSPELYPKGRGGWQDPEDYERFVDNVLTGGGLTNIPLFKALGAIKASAGGASESRINIEFINASEVKELPMTLEEIRAKDADKLTEEEKTFVAEHKTELTAEEQTKFGLEVTPPKADDENKNNEGKEDVPAPEIKDEAAVTAAIKSGTMVAVSKAEFEGLQASAKKFEQKEASEIVETHIGRGALKADAKQNWVNRLVSASAAERQQLEKDLADLPSNPVMASEQGSDKGSGAAKNATDELKEKVTAAVQASDGKKNYAEVQKEILASDTALAERLKQEREEEK